MSDKEVRELDAVENARRAALFCGSWRKYLRTLDIGLAWWLA